MLGSAAGNVNRYRPGPEMIGSFCAVTVRKELRYLSSVPSFSVGQKTKIFGGLRVTTDAGTDGKHLQT